MSQLETVDGKTFDEWVAELERDTTPGKAREIAGIMFGDGGDVTPVDESEVTNAG